MVVSAHTPCSRDLKDLNNGDFLKAPAGIASLQFGLPLFWTSAKSRGFSFHDLVQLMCKNPAILSRLEDRKGSLGPGMDADLVIWNPEKEFEVNKNIIHHKDKQAKTNKQNTTRRGEHSRRLSTFLAFLQP
nr:probable allantoinase 1 [Podarcis muralis]